MVQGGKGTGRSGAISRNGGTVRGRVRQKSHKQACLLALGTLRSPLAIASASVQSDLLNWIQSVPRKSMHLSKYPLLETASNGELRCRPGKPIRSSKYSLIANPMKEVGLHVSEWS